MTTLDLHGLGARTRLTVEGDRASELLDALRSAWSRCLSPQDDEIEAEPLTVSLSGDLAPAMQGITQDVTRAFIRAQRGRLFLFHSGAVTCPRTGGAVAYVAPGGTGKTTLSRVLGATHGYVTDETVGFTADGRIRPYPKPLSVRSSDGGGVKDEISPDALGLEHVHPDAHLRRLVLLTRDAAATSPVVEELNPLDAILRLTSESSSLSSLDRPLQTLFAFLDERPSTLAVTYAEATDLRDVMIAALEES
ncbi:MAG: hypothetical protein Q4F65_08860 [Propionibacteriaceae bacterium]|nr:hypothetical protein [Propionibacteriaceae bacterium]